MAKYVCDVCGYVYDEELGDPDNGIAPAPSGKICLKILSAPCAELARTASANSNAKKAAEGLPFLRGN